MADSAVKIAQALVRIPSVNPAYDPASSGEGGAVAWIQTWATQHGFDCQLQEVLPGRANVLIRINNGAGPTLLFNGHTDTVGVGGMTIPPFGGEISSGRLWGRGAADMKGPVACMLAAALRLHADRANWRGTLLLGLVVDEEYKYRGIQALMQTIRRPDFAVVGEPTSMRVIRGCKGCLRFVIRATGKAAHSSEPGKGRSAIVAMAECILNIERFQEQQLARIERPEFGGSTISVGTIEGGNGVNIVPETCAIQVDVRTLPGQDVNQTYAELQQFIRAHATRARDIEWTFEPPFMVDLAFEVPPQDPFVLACCGALETGKPGVVFFGCDASKIAAGGVPTVICGPGQIEQAHTADESIAVDELIRAEEMYARLAKAVLRSA